jgi:hypothetical protein
MERDFKSKSVGEPWSLTASAGPTESATLIDQLQVQRQRIERLNEYCNQTVAEIRASLLRTQEGH